MFPFPSPPPPPPPPPPQESSSKGTQSPVMISESVISAKRPFRSTRASENSTQGFTVVKKKKKNEDTPANLSTQQGPLSLVSAPSSSLFPGPPPVCAPNPSNLTDTLLRILDQCDVQSPSPNPLLTSDAEVAHHESQPINPTITHDTLTQDLPPPSPSPPPPPMQPTRSDPAIADNAGTPTVMLRSGKKISNTGTKTDTRKRQKIHRTNKLSNQRNAKKGHNVKHKVPEVSKQKKKQKGRPTKKVEKRDSEENDSGATEENGNQREFKPPNLNNNLETVLNYDDSMLDDLDPSLHWNYGNNTMICKLVFVNVPFDHCYVPHQ
jgi:hypothetical protein